LFCLLALTAIGGDALPRLDTNQNHIIEEAEGLVDASGLNSLAGPRYNHAMSDL